MQAIEFETDLKNGLIRLPHSYKNWQDGKHVKVIVLVGENASIAAEEKNRQSIDRHAGTIGLTEDPLSFQKNIRDEWE